MLTIEKLVNIIHNNTKEDKQIIDDICRFVFKYTEQKMKDTNNKEDILFNKLFKFKLKPRFK